MSEYDSRILICGFPTVGKSTCKYGMDLDYGHFRNFYRLGFEDEINRGKNYVSRAYVDFIKTCYQQGCHFIFINEPHISFLETDATKVIFAVPSYDSAEFLSRVASREDPNKKWVHEVANNFNDMVRDWIAIYDDLHNRHPMLFDLITVSEREYLSDKLSLLIRAQRRHLIDQALIEYDSSYAFTSETYPANFVSAFKQGAEIY